MESTRRTFIELTAAAGFSPATQPMRRRNLLAAGWPQGRLSAVLAAPGKWRPFPRCDERGAWEALPADVRRQSVAAGEHHLGQPWPSLPATVFLEFRRTGNRSHFEQLQFTRRRRLSELVLAECVEGRGRFLDEITNGIWLTCEETYWGLPAHVGVQKAGTGLPDAAEPTVDLFAAETSCLLAWTEYLLGEKLDRVSKLVRARIAFEADRRILTPNLERDDFGWMGLGSGPQRPVNNWNPWINSNWLVTVLLMEKDPQRRVAAVHKILRSLERFLDSYHDDGGCDEGPSYWNRAGASLFECLDVLHSASNGAMNFFAIPLVAEIGRYIYRAHIASDWYTNFADASARVSIAADLVHRFGRRIGDERMMRLGAYAASLRGGAAGSEGIWRDTAALFNLAHLKSTPPKPPLIREAWLPGVQVMTARMKEASTEGLYLAAQGGHNAESHNHNDVGNFVVYADGRPAIIDVGVETYSAKTFGANRYDIWTMRSAYHNTPTIDGVQQKAGLEFAARDVSCRLTEGFAEMKLDIAAAYPPEAGIVFWKRVLRLDRSTHQVVIEDNYNLSRQPGKIELTLMTPCQVGTAASGKLELTEGLLEKGSVVVNYDAKVFRPVVEEIKIEDAHLRSVWGERVFRILLTASSPPASAQWHVRIAQG